MSEWTDLGHGALGDLKAAGLFLKFWLELQVCAESLVPTNFSVGRK